MALKLTTDLSAYIQEHGLTTLALDGGGALGAGPSLYLSMLYRDHGWAFKAYAGTSVGSLLALLYAIGMDPVTTDNVFMETVKRIFAKPGILWRCDPTRPKYDPRELEAACLKYFGSMKMTDLKVPVLITSADMANGRAKIWDNTDDAYVRDVVLCSTAAPTYFPPRNSRYCDGGLVANNPSVIGIAGLRRAGAALEKQRMLSLATGGSFWKDPKVGARMASPQWISPVLSFVIDGNEERDEFVAQELLDDRYMRVTPNPSVGFEMDDLEHLDAWRKEWAAAYSASNLALTTFLTR